MRKLITGLSAVALTAGLGACATVTRGTSEQFTISSTPPGAQAHTTSGFNCDSTPCVIRMPRKDSFSVTFAKEGYKSTTVDVTTKIAGTGAAGFVGNALIGGVIGAAVDVGTGAALDLTPNPLNVTLAPVETAQASPAPAALPAPAVTTVVANTPASSPPTLASAKP